MTGSIRVFLVAVVVGAATVAFAQPPLDQSPAAMLKRADTDGDGRVSLEEFIKSRTANLEGAFLRMDADGDGKLDQREAEAAAEQMRSMAAGARAGARPDARRDPRPDASRNQRPGRPGPQRPGANALGEQAFDRLDADGDGKLSREEFAEGMARFREYMQGGGPRPGRAGQPDGAGRGGDEGFRKPPQQD
jgi:hypothetical protein